MAYLVIHANRMDSAICKVLQESEKAIKVQNNYCKRVCWLPKAGLRPYKPGVPTYENEYVLAQWFRDKMNTQQERVLNLLE